MQMIDVKIKRLSNDAIAPSYGSRGAACIDLHACLKYGDIGADYITIKPGETRKIGCGFAFQPPEQYVGLIFARSGLATNHGLRPANAVGVCDCDYTAEYIIPLHNDSDKVQKVYHGDRIAQLMFIPYPSVNLIEVDELNQTERGEGGFGSTGV